MDIIGSIRRAALRRRADWDTDEGISDETPLSGNRTAAEKKDRIGSLGQGTLEVSGGLFELSEGSFLVGVAAMDLSLPVSVTVMGGFGEICAMLTGVQPFEDGVQLFNDSKKTQDVWGEVIGGSKVATGASRIASAFFKVSARLFQVLTLSLVTLPEQVAAFAGVCAPLGAGLSLFMFGTLIFRWSFILVEGEKLRSQLIDVVKGALSEHISSKDAKGLGMLALIDLATDRGVENPATTCLDALRVALEGDPNLKRRLARVTKGKVVKEVEKGALIKKGVLDRTQAPEAASRSVIAHIIAKQRVRVRMNGIMIGLAAATSVLMGLSFVVTGGVPLVALLVGLLVITLCWGVVEGRGYVKAVMRGQMGRWDAMVIVFGGLLSMGLLVAASILSGGGVALVVVAGLGVLALVIHLIAFESLKRGRARAQVTSF